MIVILSTTKEVNPAISVVAAPKVKVELPKVVVGFAKLAFESVNLKFEDYVETSKKYFRPNEVDYLLGDPTKAQEGINWTPKTSFKELVKMMVDYDIQLAKRERVLIDENLISPTWESPK